MASYWCFLPAHIYWRVIRRACSCFSPENQVKGCTKSCFFRGVPSMCYRHLNQASGLGNLTADFPGSVMVFKTTRSVCIKANHYGKEIFVAVFKNREEDSEYNTVKKNRHRRLWASFLQHKCMFDDHGALCMKQSHTGPL